MFRLLLCASQTRTCVAPLAVRPGQDKDAFLAEARDAMLALQPGRSTA